MSRRGSFLVAGAVVAAGAAYWLWPWADAEPRVAVPPGPARLAESLDLASIHSPLTSVPAIASLAMLGEAGNDTILDEDFSHFDPVAQGWPDRVGSVEEVAGRQAFVVRSSKWGTAFGWHFSAEPGAYYVLERMISAAGEPDADVVAVELDDDRETVAEHWLDAPVADGTWQRGTTSFCASRRTTTVAVSIRSTPAHRMEMARWGDADRDGEVRFGEVRLTRLHPTREQAIGLLKTQSLAANADPRLGMRKYGQFPPRLGVGKSYSEADDNYSFKYALYAPPPTELSFPVDLGEHVVLELSVCLSHETRQGDAARFEVAARSGPEPKDEEVLWSLELAASPDNWRWHDARIDLSRFAGRSLDLVLRTVATYGDPQPMWGNPILDAPPPPGTLRNVILIAVDTLRADRLSCYGYARPTSPHIDALAADGVRFTQSASNANWTCPSFASIFTGVVPSEHGVFGFSNETPLPDRFETIAERFRAHGWTTTSIAYKAPLYDGGYEQGFDLTFNVPRERVRGADNLAEAMHWLEGASDHRNYLFLHFNDPHQPFTQPPPYDTKFGPSLGEVGMPLTGAVPSQSPATDDEKFRRAVRDMYDGEVAYVDEQIGAFLDALKSRGLYDDSLIVFLADHGEQLWERGLFGHGADMLFDEVVHVPLIVKPGPGDLARGTVVGDQVSGFDAMPTMLELAGVPIGDPIDAQSLVPMLATDPKPQPPRTAVTESSTGSIAARTEHWKYIRFLGGDERLYDLQADPGETDDVSAKNPAVVSQLRVVTLDQVMSHRSGLYVVVTAAEGQPQPNHTIADAAVINPLFGERPKEVEGRFRIFGRSERLLVLVADVVAAGDIVVDDMPQALADVPRYQPGDLARLLSTPSSGLHLFAGPPDESVPSEVRRAMDPEQLKALRAVGYVGDGR